MRMKHMLFNIYTKTLLFSTLIAAKLFNRTQTYVVFGVSEVVRCASMVVTYMEADGFSKVFSLGRTGDQIYKI